MSRWFRHYAGMMRDDKLVRASIKSKQSIERVLWVWGAVLESAAETDDQGRYEVDCDEIARFLRCKATHIQAVLEALKDLGRVDGDNVTAWARRQFKSDRSNDRVSQFRERKRNGGNGDVTLQERHRNSPETETETESSVAKATGGEAPVSDPDRVFWTNAKAYLKPHIKGDPGQLVGKWSRDFGKPETAQAITAAQLERPVEPVPFIEATLRKRTANGYGAGHSGIPV